MSDVLADLETKISEAQTALAPLVQAETAAIASATATTKARIAQEVQVTALEAGHLAVKARLLGSEAVTKVEAVGSAAVADVKSGATTTWKWIISHSWVGGLAAAAGYGVKWMGWL